MVFFCSILCQRGTGIEAMSFLIKIRLSEMENEILSKMAAFSTFELLFFFLGHFEGDFFASISSRIVSESI